MGIAWDPFKTGRQSQNADWAKPGDWLPSRANLFLPDAPFSSAGTLPRNHNYGPGTNNWDMVLGKTLNLSERTVLQFRWETYNLFNRVQFA